jgi:hypothetical protein
MKYSIVIFQGYGTKTSTKMSADVHVIKEKGKTVKIFPSDKGKGGKTRALHKRINDAEKWIQEHETS